MEYVCIGGAADGARVTRGFPPQPYIKVHTTEPLDFKKISAHSAIETAPVHVSHYRSEEMVCDDKKFYLYVEENLPMHVAMQMLIDNYAIGDPSKKHPKWK